MSCQRYTLYYVSTLITAMAYACIIYVGPALHPVFYHCWTNTYMPDQGTSKFWAVLTNYTGPIQEHTRDPTAMSIIRKVTSLRINVLAKKINSLRVARRIAGGSVVCPVIRTYVICSAVLDLLNLIVVFPKGKSVKQYKII